RSPPIMKVAVPLAQHSQRFGQAALWQTVWRFNSSSSARVCAKPSVVGSRVCSHADKRGRGLVAGESNPVMRLLQFSPKARELVGAKISQYLAVHVQH